jgi:hypothetical protein
MNPTVKMLLLADYAMTSSDGRLSVMGIFSNINFQSLPAAHPRFFVVIVLSLDVGVHAVQLQFLDPSGKSMVEEPATIEVHVEMPGGEANLIVDIPNFRFERPGIHQVQLLVEGRLVKSAPLGVQSAGGAPGMAAQA